MLLRTRRSLHVQSLAACVAGCIATAFASQPTPLEQLDARTPRVPPVSTQTPASVATAGGPADRLAGCTGTTYQDFEPVLAPGDSANYINPGAFFDRLRRSELTHYFVKYFEPPAGASVRIDGIGLRTLGRRGPDDLNAVGVLSTASAAPIFPTPFELGNLQRLRVSGMGPSVETCIDLTTFDIHVGPGQAAWIVVQFPEANHFVGVMADVNRTPANADHPGDYLSRDGGQIWYRPDPVQSPTYDWAFTVYATTLPFSPKVSWTFAKAIYR